MGSAAGPDCALKAASGLSRRIVRTGGADRGECAKGKELKMPRVRLICENPAQQCGSTDTYALYRHVHSTGNREWEQPGWGPTPTGLPFPDPCPDDGTQCPAVQLRCNKCAYVKYY
jgi:hypothetical protein